MSEVAQYQSYVKERRNRLFAFLAATAVFAVIALLVLWFLPDAELDTASLELRTPESYEEIFEVFAQARVRTHEDPSLPEADDADDETLFEEDEDYEFFNEDLLTEDEGLVDEESSSEEPAEDDFVFDESSLLESLTDDPDLFAEYQALLEDLALLEADDIDERDPLVEEETYMPEEELLEEEQPAEDIEHPADSEDEEYLDEDDYLPYEDDEYLDEELLYFDEEELFTGMHSVSMGFSPPALMRLAAEGAQNPHYFQSVTSGENEYLIVQSQEALYIFEFNDEEITDPVALIRPGEHPMAGLNAENAETVASVKRFTATFLVDGRLIAISTFGQEVPYDIAPFTGVQIFDLATPSSPELVSSYSITGIYSGSRVKSSVLTIATDHAVLDLDSIALETLETFVPHSIGPEGTIFTLADNIRIVGDIEYRETVYTQLVSIDLAGETRIGSQLALLGGSEIVYAGAKAVHLINNAELQHGRSFQMASTITQLQIQEASLNFGESRVLPGVIEGLCSVNEDESGMLRVVAPAFSYSEAADTDDFIAVDQSFTTEMQIFVLDERLEIAASLDGFGDSEILYPQHFVNDILFLSSAEYEDQGYQVDLSNLENLQFSPQSEAANLPKMLVSWPPLYEATWIGLGVTDEGWDDPFEESEDSDFAIADVGSLTLEMLSLDDSTINSSHSTLVEGYYFSDAFIYPESLFIEAASGIIAFPADEDFVVYSFDPNNGFERQLEHPLRGNFHSSPLIRSGIIGDFFVLLQQADSTNIWLYHKADFSEAGHFEFSSLAESSDPSD